MWSPSSDHMDRPFSRLYGQLRAAAGPRSDEDPPLEGSAPAAADSTTDE